MASFLQPIVRGKRGKTAGRLASHLDERSHTTERSVSRPILKAYVLAAAAAAAGLWGCAGAPRGARARPPVAYSGNPILPGWYADPEAHVFAGRYWIFPTYSARYEEQTFLDAFSSPDLVTW